MMKKTLANIIICVFFLIRYSISLPAMKGYIEDSIEKQVDKELNPLKKYDTVSEMLIEARGLARNYIAQKNDNTKLNNLVIELHKNLTKMDDAISIISDFAKIACCAAGVRSLMEQLNIRASPNGKISKERLDIINAELGKLHDDRIKKMQEMMKIFSQNVMLPEQTIQKTANSSTQVVAGTLTREQSQKMNFQKAWRDFKNLKIHSKDGRITEYGDKPLWDAIMRLNGTEDVETAYNIWRDDAFWKEKKDQWAGKNPLSTEEKRTVVDLTASLHLKYREIAVNLNLRSEEVDYVRSITHRLLEVWPTKIGDLPSPFKECCWYFNGELTVPYQNAFNKFKKEYFEKLNHDKSKQNEADLTKPELVNVFCTAYSTINQVVSLINFHPSDAIVPPPITISDLDLEKYVLQISKKDPLVAEVVRVLLEIGVNTDAITTSTRRSTLPETNNSTITQIETNQ